MDRNSIKRVNAKEVFVFQQKSILKGMITFGEKEARGDIGILAVDETARGMAIGKKLVKHVEKYCFENRYDELQVVTQKANIAACKFYEKCGFTINSIVNIYHLWKNKI